MPSRSPARRRTSISPGAAGGAEAAAEQRRRDLGLEAAALAARADRAVGIDDDVADLARRRARAAVQRAVEHEPDTDTLVDPDHQEVGRVGDAERELGERRGVGVVGDVDARARCGPRAASASGEPGSTPSRAARSTVPSRSTMPGLATPMPSSGRSASPIRSSQIVAEQRERLGAGAVVALVGAAQHDLAGEVDERADELVGLGQADGHDVAGVGLDADHRRRLADAAAGAPELVDQAGVEQFLDHGRHGRRGEPDQLGEVGPRGRAAVVQRPQDQPPVRSAGVLRQHPRLAGEAIAESISGSRSGGRHIHLFVYLLHELTPVNPFLPSVNRFARSARQWGVRADVGSCSDTQLVSLIADRSRDAFAELYRRHGGWLLARLRHRCADDGLAAEALQDTFLAVWRGAGQLRRSRLRRRHGCGASPSGA